MALPKRKQSKARSRKRRTHWKLKQVTLIECSHCHQPKLPHHVCPNCGYYRGRPVLTPKES